MLPPFKHPKEAFDLFLLLCPYNSIPPLRLLVISGQNLLTVRGIISIFLTFDILVQVYRDEIKRRLSLREELVVEIFDVEIITELVFDAFTETNDGLLTDDVRCCLTRCSWSGMREIT